MEGETIAEEERILRLRMNLFLRNSAEDKSQGMLNAIEPGRLAVNRF